MTPHWYCGSVRFTRATGHQRSPSWGEVGEVSRLGSLAHPAHVNRTHTAGVFGLKLIMNATGAIETSDRKISLYPIHCHHD